MIKDFDNIDRVVVINDSTTARGGAAALALLNAKLLRLNGVAVTYFAGDDGDIDGSLTESGIDCVALRNPSLLEGSISSALTRGLFNMRAYMAMRNWIKKNDTPCTVYHLHGWQQILSPSIFLALKPVAKRTLYHAHDYFLICPNGGQMNYVTNKSCDLRPMSLKCVTTNCDKRNFAHKIWRVGRQSIRNTFSDLKDDDVKVLLIQKDMGKPFESTGVPAGNLVDLPNPCVPFSESRVQAELNNEFHFVGRLVEEKGIRQFLAAARLAKVKARVMGDGPLKQSLIDQYPEVTFEGWCDRSRLTHISQSARMLVMPSLYPEPFGLVVPEAVASGIPAVLSSSALLSQDVLRANVGVTVEPNDLLNFASLLEQFSSDNDAIGTMSKKGFSGLDQMSMRPEKWILKLLDIYSQLANNEVKSACRNE